MRGQGIVDTIKMLMDRAEYYGGFNQETTNEIRYLYDFVINLGRWIDEGEDMMDKRYMGILFHLGEWWADRPWRKDKKWQ